MAKLPDDDEITFRHDDSAEELLRAAEFLRDQTLAMKNSEALTEEEREYAQEAVGNLASLVHTLEERLTRELIADSDTDTITESLKGVHDLSGDIMSELEEFNHQTLDAVLPGTNPYDVAEESGHAAKEFAEDIRDLADDIEDGDSDDDDLVFGDWLAETLDGDNQKKNVIHQNDVIHNTLVSRDRLEAILNGDEPNGDEGPSILKFLEEHGYTNADTRAYLEDELESSQ